ncbi:unnamed protein product [Staurois parvus]|uniref:Uncharacterized protein n=1 Tax=Staurois parvus TaxID=386267 RepID=A0ABN9F6B3_9NEOB|nr:unnamed protein product [Staurois parvus]
MANSGLQMLGFVLSLIGWIALIAATICRNGGCHRTPETTSSPRWPSTRDCDELRDPEHGADPVQGVRLPAAAGRCPTGHPCSHGGRHHSRDIRHGHFHHGDEVHQMWGR